VHSLQPAVKQAQEWEERDGVGHPVVDMAKDNTCTRTGLDREIGKDRYKQTQFRC